jgi:hypothetical protein
MRTSLLLLSSLFLLSCKEETRQINKTGTGKVENKQTAILHRNPNQKVIHVFVALCDNKYQGIVPVPKAIGNGQDAANNLYWGCDYGIKTFFKKSKEWTLISSMPNPKNMILERCVFRHKNSNTFLVADAYDGEYIRTCTQDFFKSCAGQTSDSIFVKCGEIIYVSGNADLIAYVGHDGLMNFSISEKYNCIDTLKREAIILACISKSYFAEHLKETHSQPLVWSTGLMAPEAYTLHDAIESWINKQPASIIRESAAKAYSKYQHCSYKAAKNLLVSGW